MRSNFAHNFQYLLTATAFLGLRVLPRRLRGAVGILLGQLFYYTGIRRKTTRQNLLSAFPTLPDKAIRSISARVYRHFGSVAVSLSAIPKLEAEDTDKWIHIQGLSVLQGAVEEGRGCLVFSGHLGNWELMGAIVARIGLPVTFVVTTQRNKRIEAMMDNIRRSTGVEIVKRRDAIRGVISALKRNRCVALLIDQDAHEDGAFVRFFGRAASTPRGPAVFHLRTGAPLVFAQCIRLPGERYLVDINRFNTEGVTDADELTARMTARLEEAIRETPEQWFWMHRRWKTLPPKS